MRCHNTVWDHTLEQLETKVICSLTIYGLVVLAFEFEKQIKSARRVSQFREQLYGVKVVRNFRTLRICLRP